MKLGLVVALKAEARALLGRGRWASAGGRKVKSVSLPGGDELITVISGVGKQKALSAAQWLVETAPGALLSLGLAGGVNPEVKPGDVVIAEKVIEEGKGPVWRADGLVVGSACEALKSSSLRVRSGAVVTTSLPALSVEDKKTIYMRDHALAVDMESAAVAKAAELAGLPLFVMRAVSDGPGQSISREIFDCLDEEGGVNPGAFLRNTLKRPAMLQEAFGLRKGFNAGLSSLATAWETLVQKRFYALFAQGREKSAER
ncbi:MAG: hypothetical protein BMS9Abin23_0725 [Thermodesulfobacteriota bacterium]|nr:MAG: hypothetical protein BMS9Abin23_0725 [Thermodesulfobacteriota bacterium]